MVEVKCLCRLSRMVVGMNLYFNSGSNILNYQNDILVIKGGFLLLGWWSTDREMGRKLEIRLCENESEGCAAFTSEDELLPHK